MNGEDWNTLDTEERGWGMLMSDGRLSEDTRSLMDCHHLRFLFGQHEDRISNVVPRFCQLSFLEVCHHLIQFGGHIDTDSSDSDATLRQTLPHAVRSSGVRSLFLSQRL